MESQLNENITIFTTGH